MADISKITLPSGTTYDIKDQGARDLIDALESYSSYLGVTTTALTDGATTNPITIGGQSITAKAGSIVNYGSKEFIFNGTAWQEFGDLSALGALAYKDSASGSFTPAGTVSKPTFTGSSSNVTITATDNTSGNYQPKGTVSKPTFTGSATTSTGKFTPEGSVSAPTISVSSAGSTTSIHNPTKVTVAKTLATAAPGATAPSNAITYYAVANETLSLYQIGYTTGDSITTTDVTVKTGDASYNASAPTFTGTEGNVSVSGTPSGSVSQPTFTGTKTQLAGTTTAAGSVSQPTFSGTAGTVTVS